MIQAGKRIKARGTIAGLGYSGNGQKQVAVELELLSGPDVGHCITWYGYFTEGTMQRTLESLRHLGWRGDNISVLEGIDANEVSIEIAHEEYQGEVTPKVRWINAEGGLAMKAVMTPAEALAFAREIRGAVIQSNKTMKERSGTAPAAKPATSTKPKNGTAPPQHAPNAPDFGDDDISF